jgi:hypothetical protein
MKAFHLSIYLVANFLLTEKEKKKKKQAYWYGYTEMVCAIREQGHREAPNVLISLNNE